VEAGIVEGNRQVGALVPTDIEGNVILDDFPQLVAGGKNEHRIGNSQQDAGTVLHDSVLLDTIKSDRRTVKDGQGFFPNTPKEVSHFPFRVAHAPASRRRVHNLIEQQDRHKSVELTSAASVSGLSSSKAITQ
jgi:hypothetical protein